MTKQVITDNFAKEIETGVSLVDFGATWCPPCQMMEPVIDELSRDFAGKATIVKVDVDQSPELAQMFNIRSIPTMIFFKDGQAIDATLGVQSKKSLAEKIEASL
ncbi:thioredoxin [Streptococcus halotolerans]|uniref:thioredoxin n=1 Tax=Streptococcus halotolerans TaxID=1814128 RepID=UPI000787F7C2|nr:thioredoxin [Streptococcus halotolerans]